MHRYKGCCGATQPIKTTDAIKERHKICLKCFFSPCGEELQKIHKNDKDIQKLERVKNTYYPQLLIDSLRNIYKQALLEIRNDTMKDVRNIDYLINKTNFYDMLTKNLNADEYEDIPSKEDFIRLCEYVKKLNNNYSYVTNEYNKKLHKYKKIIIFGVIIEIISVAILIFFILNL